MSIANQANSAESTDQIRKAFEAFVTDQRFPCLAGKGAVHRGDHTLRVYDVLGTTESAKALARDLSDFRRSQPADAPGLRAFVALFRSPTDTDELTFERRLWRQLRRLHALDASDVPWDPSVSDDPENAQFSFCFEGQALFVVGMHPSASRLARRFAWPALVFNPREQFERLRAEGKFERLRERVRERDIALQGSLNPNLADFGERSEARQYSGREVEADWRCPFHRKDP
jgi:FPC/CPF motif-containing protein YcgG